MLGHLRSHLGLRVADRPQVVHPCLHTKLDVKISKNSGKIGIQCHLLLPIIFAILGPFHFHMIIYVFIEAYNNPARIFIGFMMFS